MQRPLLLVLAALAFAACDSGPTSVEDFDIQPAITVSTTSLTFTAGQTPAATFTVRYQGLDAAPEATAAAGVDFELVEETGSPQSGSRTWAVSYSGDVPSAGSVEELVTIRSVSGGREILDEVRLQVNSPVSITETFQSRLAVVEDYEGEVRQLLATGGTTTQVVTDVVASNSSGLRALRVDASGSGSVVFARPVNAPGQGVFSFLLRSDDAFTLTVAFADQAGAEVETFTVDVPVEGGGVWRRYTIAATQLFDGFNPVAVRSGGDGPLQNVSFSASAAATYYLDDIAFGTSDGPTIEVEDFESTNNAYNCGLAQSDTDGVAAGADGITGRRFTYTEGGNCFGYNFQSDGPALFLDAGSNAALRLTIGNVSRAFNLYVFVETGGGAYAYGTGEVVSIAAGGAFRTVTVPLADLGGSLGALKSPGITNVGFEVRRPDGDSTTEPISFTLDDVKLVGGN